MSCRQCFLSATEKWMIDAGVAVPSSVWMADGTGTSGACAVGCGEADPLLAHRTRLSRGVIYHAQQPLH